MERNTAAVCEQLFENSQILFGLAGTLLYHEPTSVILDQLISKREVLEDPALQAMAPEGAPALSQALTALSANDASPLRQLLLQEYAALFIQRTVSKVYPWESVYTTHDHTLFGESELEVKALYREFGITFGASTNEPQDHIGLEFLFLSHISEKGILALEQEDRAKAERLQAVQASFLSEHILVFANDFLAALESKAETDYYKAVCSFTRDTLTWARSMYSL